MSALLQANIGSTLNPVLRAPLNDYAILDLVPDAYQDASYFSRRLRACADLLANIGMNEAAYAPVDVLARTIVQALDCDGLHDITEEVANANELMSWTQGHGDYDRALLRQYLENVAQQMAAEAISMAAAIYEAGRDAVWTEDLDSKV